jgi:hypothetical protein
MNFYEKFESICNEKGTTPSAVAKAAGFSNSVAAYWKSSGATPKSGTIQALAKTLGVSQEELLEAQNDETVISTTGMSQKALNAIKTMRNKSYVLGNGEDKRHIIDVFNLFMESDTENFFDLLQVLTRFENIQWVFEATWDDAPPKNVLAVLPDMENYKNASPEDKKSKYYQYLSFIYSRRKDLHEELDKILERMQASVVKKHLSDQKKAHNAHT